MSFSEDPHPQLDEVSIRTIDLAVKSWFDKTVDAHAEDPKGELKKVPVVMSSGERWVTSRTKRAIRDEKGVLMLPVISVRRVGIDTDPKMMALGVQTPNLTISKQISQKTNNLQDLYPGRAPQFRGPDKPVVYEITTIPFPRRFIFTYEFAVQAQYQKQMNSVLEKTFQELDLQRSFVATFENDGRHTLDGDTFEERPPVPNGYVVGFFEGELSDRGNLEEFTDQERIIRYTTTVRVPAGLVLDSHGEKPNLKVTRTAFKLGFGDEQTKFVSDPKELDEIFGKKE